MSRVIMDTNTDIVFDAKIFIIPNNVWKCDQERSIGRNQAKRMQSLCEANGTSFNPEEDLVFQGWYHSKWLHCDNIADHNIYFDNKNGQRCTIIVPSRGVFPVKLFQNHKEGETIKIKLPIDLCIENIDDNGEVYDESYDRIAEVTFTCQQKGYRYARFGDFNKVMDDLIHYYNTRNSIF